MTVFRSLQSCFDEESLLRGNSSRRCKILKWATCHPYDNDGGGGGGDDGGDDDDGDSGGDGDDGDSGDDGDDDDPGDVAWLSGQCRLIVS